MPETVQVTLRPDTTSARLTISTGPDASIRIDGKYMGQGTWEGTVLGARLALDCGGGGAVATPGTAGAGAFSPDDTRIFQASCRLG